jgi:hypothetical protein
MGIISRQTGLLSAENWKKVYQTFREADFTAYDFETLRKTMIDYVKRNYPEDFNDFTESSEFIALIDLIAFFGQSLAFRADLNARENFIDTAERRDSILKLARLVSYNPKRNQPATGYIKIDSVSTTELLYDSDGNNLSTLIINWNDAGNENWLEQFTAVLNAAIVSSQSVGKPGNRNIVNGIRTDEYGINITRNVLPIYRFSTSIDNQDMTFEIVSPTSTGQNYVYEEAPSLGKMFNFLHMNDGLGNSSKNTGYFLYFKQGELKTIDFSIDEVVENKVINIDTNNINNNDIWLYSLDSANRLDQLWTSVPSINGVNVIYNKSNSARNLYQINSRVNDQISLVFGDGIFTNLPSGPFRLYYRTSNGLTYKITPDEMQGVEVSLDYISRFGRVETITMRASLRYTVANASARESSDSIKQRAPQQYYTQNRMVTGEDYNILPYTNYNSILKVQAVNRTSSGLSRYLDILDTTGKYSSTNIFGADGVLYREYVKDNVAFTFNNQYDIQAVIANIVETQILRSKEMLHQYYDMVKAKKLSGISLPASAMLEGENYEIQTIGNTNFTNFGASSNVVGLKFVAVDVGFKTFTHNVTSLIVENRLIYVFSDVLNPYNTTFNLKVGDTLILDVATPGNPLWIKTAPTTGTDSAVGNSGLSHGIINNNGTDNGRIFWNTSNIQIGIGGIATFYYISQYNPSMTGIINITSYGNGEILKNITWTASTLGDSASTGYFDVNRKPVSPKLGAEGTSYENFGLCEAGSLIKFVAPPNYYFNSINNLVPGIPGSVDDKLELYAAIMHIKGDGTNNYKGNSNIGIGPVALNLKIPRGAILDSVIPKFKNSLPDYVKKKMLEKITEYSSFGLRYIMDSESPINTNLKYDPTSKDSLSWPGWDVVETNLDYDPSIICQFYYDSKAENYIIETKQLRYVFYSEQETNFFYDPSLQVYDSFNNSVVRDHIKILKNNSKLNAYNDTISIGRDFIWQVYKPVRRSDGFIDNKSIYVTFADTNDDSVPDSPYLFEHIVEPFINPESKLIFFELIESRHDQFKTWRLIKKENIITSFRNIRDLRPVINNYDVGQLFFTMNTKQFFKIILNTSRQKIISPALNTDQLGKRSQYKFETGLQNLYFQYRHNSPNTNRVDPNISNIVDIYVLTAAYNSDYRRYIQDITGRLFEPTAPTSTELQVDYVGLEKFKTISDTMIFHSATFKPLFGSKAESAMQAVFKVVKNPNLNISDTEVKTSVVNAINEYFAAENWDFGETFYFSELAAYLHKELTPKVASIIIVPRDPDVDFGALYQINCEPNEIIISSATANDIEIISSININQLGQPSMRRQSRRADPGMGSDSDLEMDSNSDLEMSSESGSGTGSGMGSGSGSGTGSGMGSGYSPSGNTGYSNNPSSQSGGYGSGSTPSPSSSSYPSSSSNPGSGGGYGSGSTPSPSSSSYPSSGSNPGSGGGYGGGSPMNPSGY